MKKIYLLIFYIIITIGCESKTDLKTDLNPVYNNYENAWEERNLYDNVKEVKQYKTIFQNSNQEGESVLSFKELYTEFGSTKQTEYYGNSGKLLQKDTYEYDENGYIVKFTSKNLPPNLKIVQIIENDTINKVIKRMVFINDSIDQISTEYYNDKDYITKHITIEDNNTTVALNTYKFNKQNQILSTVQKEKETGDTLLFNHYIYNENGNFIEFTKNNPEWGGFITETEWENDRIIKQKQYNIYLDLTEHLNEITEYDKLFNPINSKKYTDSKLNTELKYEYKFDDHGNWIERLVLMKEHYVNSKEFTPAYVEKRKIKYWN